MKWHWLLACLVLLTPLQALEIEIRYDYDSQGFFNQPGSREAMEEVAEFYEQRIHDSLAEIDADAFGGPSSWTAYITHPGTGNQQALPDLVVPADTIIVYVGGRNIGGSSGVAGPGGFSASGYQSWFDRIRYRGQAGAQANPPTDFGPWGGQITFNNTMTWHFQTDSQPVGNATDFVSVALHEMAHVLGFGTCDAWDGAITAGSFTGAVASASFGASIPLDPNQGHWKDNGCQFPGPFAADSLSHGSFGTPHGQAQVALMDPVSCSDYFQTELNVVTDLDLAALIDIGWEVVPPLLLSTESLNPAGSSFSWPTTTGVTQTLQRSGNLATWTDIAGPTAGDGTMDSHDDSSPPPGPTYYRLQASTPAAAAAPLPPAAAAAAAPQAAPTTISSPERTTTCCGSPED